MKSKVFFFAALFLAGCSAQQIEALKPIIETVANEINKRKAAADQQQQSPQPISTPISVAESTAHAESVTLKKQAPRAGDCDLIKFDGAKPRFLVLRSSTDKRNIKLLTPGLYTAEPEEVNFFWNDGKKATVKPCSKFLANPDQEKEGEFLRGHYCYTGSKMPDSVQVGECPAIKLPTKCKKVGRCD